MALYAMQNIRNKNSLWHKPLAQLLALLLLIAQSVPVWADIARSGPIPQANSHSCMSMSGFQGLEHSCCVKDDCTQLKHCSTTGFMQCADSIMSILPVSLYVQNPRFLLNSVSQFQITNPDGWVMSVLDRPPRQFL